MVDQVGEPLAECAVADLIVVLGAIDERRGRLVGDSGASELAGGRAFLALEQEALLDGGGDVGELTGVVGVVGVALVGEVGAEGVVEVVGPDAVESEPAGCGWPSWVTWPPKPSCDCASATPA